jgi:hypothetical protein
VRSGITGCQPLSRQLGPFQIFGGAKLGMARRVAATCCLVVGISSSADMTPQALRVCNHESRIHVFLQVW